MKKKMLIVVILVLLVVGGILFLFDPFYLRKVTNTNIFDTQNNNEEYDKNLDNHFIDENSDDLMDEIVGKWNTFSAVSAESGIKVTNLRDIFGSSYSQYGSFLELKDDGTFIDAIEPITVEDKVVVGKYEIKRDYNKPGDCYVFLFYSDGRENKLKRVILDDSNTYYLILEEFISGYQFTLKK